MPELTTAHQPRRSQSKAQRLNRLRSRDLFAEAVASLRVQGGRALLAVAGTAMAAAALVTMAGVGDNLRQQVSGDFDALQATQLTAGLSRGVDDVGWISPVSLARVRSLHGVTSAGVLTRPIATSLVRPPSKGQYRTVVRRIEPELLAGLELQIVDGRLFDAFQAAHGIRVVLLSREVARRIGVRSAGERLALDGTLHSVIGIFDRSPRVPDLLHQVVIPFGQANAVPVGVPVEVLVVATPRSAQVLSRAVATALSPGAPSAVTVSVPPNPERFRRGVEDSVENFTLAASLVALGLGTASVASSASAGVMSRTGEIGLRIALGGQRRHIVGQILLEVVTISALSGCIGAFLGLVVSLASSAWIGVPVQLPVSASIKAVAAACMSGAIAGAWPAAKAARVQPVDALSR